MSINELMQKTLVNQGNSSRVEKAFLKAENGEDITVAFIGGSITMGSQASDLEKCYAHLVYQYLVEKLPNSKVKYINAGIGATGSDYGVARADEDVLSDEPDLIFVEFSVNDGPNEYFEETFEGLIRKLLNHESAPAVVVINSVKYDSGDNAQSIHNRIASYYDLPTLSMRNSIYAEIQAGNIDKSEITEDDIHPIDKGHALVAAIINEYLNSILEDVDASKTASEYIVQETALTKNTYVDAIRYRNSNIEPEMNKFNVDTRIQNGISDMFKCGWYSDEANSSLKFKVYGSNIALQYIKYANTVAPVAYAYIDNDKNNKIILDGNSPETWGNGLHVQNILTGSSTKEHTIEIIIEELPEDCKESFYLSSVLVSNL